MRNHLLGLQFNAFFTKSHFGINKERRMELQLWTVLKIFTNPNAGLLTPGQSSALG
jgi:hypothetical protein